MLFPNENITPVLYWAPNSARQESNDGCRESPRGHSTTEAIPTTPPRILSDGLGFHGMFKEQRASSKWRRVSFKVETCRHHPQVPVPMHKHPRYPLMHPCGISFFCHLACSVLRSQSPILPDALLLFFSWFTSVQMSNAQAGPSPICLFLSTVIWVERAMAKPVRPVSEVGSEW